MGRAEGFDRLGDEAAVDDLGKVERVGVVRPPVLAVQGPGTPNLAYSPVINTRLALTADSIAGFTLRTLSDDGSADSVLVTAGANQSFRRPKWSPDGAFIAVERLTRGPGCALSSFTNINILIVDAVTGVRPASAIETDGAVVEIPTRYDGPDLDAVALGHRFQTRKVGQGGTVARSDRPLARDQLLQSLDLRTA